MDSEEFNELKRHYLSMPDCMIPRFDKSARVKMGMFYQKVKEINNRRKISSQRYDRYENT